MWLNLKTVLLLAICVFFFSFFFCSFHSFELLLFKQCAHIHLTPSPRLPNISCSKHAIIYFYRTTYDFILPTFVCSHWIAFNYFFRMIQNTKGIFFLFRETIRIMTNKIKQWAHFDHYIERRIISFNVVLNEILVQDKSIVFLLGAKRKKKYGIQWNQNIVSIFDLLLWHLSEQTHSRCICM